MKDCPATRIKSCERCGKLADYNISIDEQIIENYYDDEDGNLQMNIKTEAIFIDICEEHLPFYLDKGYSMVGQYKKYDNVSYKRINDKGEENERTKN